MIRARFAPSPTGYLHIGSARTFIFNWLFVRKHQGVMVLRIDDTDVDRNTQASLDSIYDGLNWLALGWDEFYRQSQRLEQHRKLAYSLLEKGLAYRDFTPAIANSEDKAHGDGPWLCNPEMRALSKDQSDARAAAGEPFVIRFRVKRDPAYNVTFDDLVFSVQSKLTADIEDFALLRSNGMPTYHLASCADDIDLKISHVIRGQDHLSNTYKHVLIFQAAGATMPLFAHLPLLIAPDGSKLSKRKHGPVVSVTTYRDHGFLALSYINFLCLLGWSPKDNREQMSLLELQNAFTFEGVNRSNAVVNFSDADPIDPKALWLNSQHLRSMPAEQLAPLVKKVLADHGLAPYGDEKFFEQVVDIIRSRFSNLFEFATRGRAYFTDDFPTEPAALEKLNAPGARELLRELSVTLANSPEFTEASIEADLRKLAADRGVKAGVLINASRAALTGQRWAQASFTFLPALGVSGPSHDWRRFNPVAQILIGLGGLLSDPACCVIKDGVLSSAVEQAKVSRQDRPGSFPDEAFALALEVAGVTAEEIACVALARPFARGTESNSLLAMRARFPKSEIVVVEHHHAHAASAYFASGFEQASVLSVDRAGDFRSAALFQGHGNQLNPVRELYFPDSLGDLFNRVTELLGYEPRADEHKVQWLSASGTPTYRDVFWSILHRTDSNWPHIDRSYFDSDHLAEGGFAARFYTETKLPPPAQFTQEDKADLAASLQRAVEDCIIAMLNPAPAVCIAGGLGMNALLIKRLEETFPRVFVQPVAGNAGTALGAALYAWHNFLDRKQRVAFNTLCLGPSYKPMQVKEALENCKLRFRYLLTEGELIKQAIASLQDNKIVAWMQGRMEFGPRALGNRSILASPLNPYSTENLNVYIKHRENFRKFAASVPEENAAQYFEVDSNARYLATVGRVRSEYQKTFAAATLSQDLIRVHTVSKDENPLYHALLVAAGEKTGLPVLYNTSFNLFGDPLVCTPRDAVRSFYSSGIDALFAGSFFLEK